MDVTLGTGYSCTTYLLEGSKLFIKEDWIDWIYWLDWMDWTKGQRGKGTKEQMDKGKK